MLAVFASILCCTAYAHETGTAVYTSPRFGFTIRYPSTFEMQPPPDSDDGRIFMLGDQCKVIASGSNNVLDATVKSEIRDFAKDLQHVESRRYGSNWGMVVGTKGNKRIYVKTFVGPGSVNHLWIEQPRSGKPCHIDTDALARGFKPGSLR